MSSANYTKTTHARRFWIPYFVFAVGLMFTAAFAWYVHSTTKASAQQRFDSSVGQTVSTLEERLRDALTMLHDTRRVFGSNAVVRREEFRAYVQNLLWRTTYPGIQGIGFAMWVRPKQKLRLVASMRRQGHSSFRVWPDQPADSYPIIFLEPLDARNQKAIGYDMFTEPVRRAAMLQARDTGQATASGKITLVQEIDGKKQAGFLIYLPVYWGGAVPLTREERIATFRGFVYSPFRAGDLFLGILGAQQNPPGIRFRVFEGTETTADNLLYISSPERGELRDPGEFNATRTVPVAGRTWTISFTSEPGLGSRPLLQPALLISAMGAAISILLFAVTRVQALAYATAERHAADMRVSRQAALESEARKRAMLELALDCVITIDHEGKVVEFNPAAEKTFGYQNGDVVGKMLADLIIPPELRDKHRAGLKRHLATGESGIIGRRIEVTAMRADGTEFPVELAVTRIDVNEQPLFTAYLRDITARKQAVELLRRVIESAPSAMVMTNARGEIVLVNGQTEKLFGYQREELINQPIELLVAERFRQNHPGYRRTFMHAPDARPMGAGRDLFARRKDGSEFPVEIRLNPLNTNDGMMVLSAIVDITAHRRAEDAMKSTLREKEVLLKETHHRVKNNLQIISSLLDLQTSTLRDPRVLQSVQESQHRIRAMALIHEKLYQSPDLAEVDLAEYVDNLTAYLVRAYRFSEARVALKLDTEPVRLRIDAAIPCGLILNELVSNALKHAFPGDCQGTIIVTVKEQEPGQVTVAISDDGVGMPSEIDWRTTSSLGLRLVNILTRQLQGTLTVQTTRGTSFHISFPLNEGGQELHGERPDSRC